MSSPSPSAVASLRARFEQNGEDTSPPSRGRSPTGSVTSNSSRPLSKVRTSFVAVEPSGYMASEISSKGLDGTTEAVAGDNMESVKQITATLDDESTDQPRTNGNETYLQDKANPTINVTGDQPSAESTKSSKPEKATDDPKSMHPSRPVSTAGDHAAPILPAGPNDEGAVSGGAALAGQIPELGSILKGSPFEETTSKPKAAIPALARVAPSSSQSSKAQNKAPSAGPVTSKPKGAQPLKSASTQPQGPQNKASTGGVTNGKGKAIQAAESTTELKPKATPAPIETEPAASMVPSTALEPAETKREISAPSAPQTSISATTSGKQQQSKAAPPANTAATRPDATHEPKKDETKEVEKPASRPSAPAKLSGSMAPKPAQISTASTAKTVKKPGPTSPAFAKPKPKSPTRPVRLPAAATAPTAASAAKLDGASSSAASVTRDRTASNTKPTMQKTARASLPAGSKPAEKPKAAKTRMSMAGTQAPSGSFLERMMRPTQSSAQKTHEKVEVKSPPRKSHPLRHKRTSDGSEKSRSEQGETKGELTQEAAVEASQLPAEANDAPSKNVAGASINGMGSTGPSAASAK